MDPSRDIPPGLLAYLDQRVRALLDEQPGLVCKDDPPCELHRMVWTSMIVMAEAVRAAITDTMPDLADAGPDEFQSFIEADPVRFVEAVLAGISTLTEWRVALGALMGDMELG